jgi:hypothetical protein
MEMHKMRKLNMEQQQAAGGSLRKRRRPPVDCGGQQQDGNLALRQMRQYHHRLKPPDGQTLLAGRQMHMAKAELAVLNGLDKRGGTHAGNGGGFVAGHYIYFLLKRSSRICSRVMSPRWAAIPASRSVIGVADSGRPACHHAAGVEPRSPGKCPC